MFLKRLPNSLTPLLLLPLAALFALHPLLVHGISCGQDMGFHIQSWLDAARQLRHLHYPHWAYSPAWNAGEPRFTFYPPLSWLLGALLVTLLPANFAPIAFLFVALTASGLTLHHLARQYVSPNVALLVAALYIANPYMLYNAFERTAFAELLAAAWIPLLLLAVLRPNPTLRVLALPIALLWLTNAPAAVMGCYLLALLATLRVLYSLKSCHPERSEGPASRPSRQALRLVLTYLGGTALGLALPAFYLVPAAHQRRFVQVAMAIIPNMRFQDNFLFTNTADAPHNAVNHTASLLALTLLLLTFATITALLLLKKDRPTTTPNTLPTAILLIPALFIALLLVPISTPLWLHLPNFEYLQFPWRLLTLLAPILCLSLALLLNRIQTFLTPNRTYTLALLLALALSAAGYTLYSQSCSAADLPETTAELLATHHGFPPTDEYTPTDADNDHLRTDNPAYWLALNPNAPAPNTTPTPTELNPNILNDDSPIPPDQTLSQRAPAHLVLNLPAPLYLVLNLRAYPNWRLTLNNVPTTLLTRDDGLIVLALPAGTSTIDLHWHRTPDQTLGFALTLLALLAVCLTYDHDRTSKRRIPNP